MRAKPASTPAEFITHKIYNERCMDLALTSIESERGGKNMIRKTKEGYKVLSENGKKNLGGPYKSKAEAQKRLRQVEYFKHKG